MDMEKVISNIEQQIRWIEEIECHKFPGWLSATNAMRDAIALLKEQNDAIEKADSMLKIAEDKIKELLKEQPQTVRCKDCKHAVAQDCEQVWCSFVDDGLAHEPNWFCADGERRTDDA